MFSWHIYNISVILMELLNFLRFSIQKEGQTHTVPFLEIIWCTFWNQEYFSVLYFSLWVFFLLIRVKCSLNFDIHSPYITKKDSNMVVQMAACFATAILIWKFDIPESPCSHNWSERHKAHWVLWSEAKQNSHFRDERENAVMVD